MLIPISLQPQGRPWFNISAIDVLDASASSVAILGNSITDGKGCVTNAQDRWPDFMSAVLNGEHDPKIPNRCIESWYWR